MKRKRRDRGWVAMYEVSGRMSAKYGRRVNVVRRRGRHGVTEGIAFRSRDAFEPVRCRSWFSRHWYEVQPLQDAANRIEARLR